MTKEKRTDHRVGSSGFISLNRLKTDFSFQSVSDVVMTNVHHLNQLEGSLYHPLSVPYNYKYSGKELQETGMYDFGWRHYMPDIGRWNGMDQLSEMYYSFSPYVYVLNNPVSLTDPDGRKVTETADGWVFTGASIQGVMDYFGNGGDYGDLVTILENTDFGNGPITDFWNTYNISQPVIMLNETTLTHTTTEKSKDSLKNSNKTSEKNQPKDIIVLLATNGASGLGHESVIIGNDKDGYIYISKDGRANGDILKGGDSKATIKVFNNYEEALAFANTQYDFDKSTRYVTDSKQDLKASLNAIHNAQNGYQARDNNCSAVVNAAMYSAGFNIGISVIPNINYYELRLLNSGSIKK